MPDNTLRVFKLPVAERGAKVGWPTLSGQVPQETADAVDRLAAALLVPRTEIIRRAIAEYVERHAGESHPHLAAAA